MIKPTPLSGFPEWLPGQQLAEQRVIDIIRNVYELHGFSRLETSAVERVSILGAKGEINKEIYGLGRLQGPPGRWEMALHFDLTVPLSRYVAQNSGSITFPFKRWQIQKVWRGERPQEGRFREFYQADIDVIGDSELPLSFDAELPAVIHEVFQKLGIRAQININNRKVLLGYYISLGLDEAKITEVLREIDKIDKIGPNQVKESLLSLGLDEATADKCLKLCTLRGTPLKVIEQAKALNVQNEIFCQGLTELEFVAEELADLDEESLIFNLGIVRGLDYYTGTIYETMLPDYPSLGSICSGGRYDNLASEFINRRLPGVGISIGLSRLISHLFNQNALDCTRQTPTRILLSLPEERLRPACRTIARALREAGIPTEIYHEVASLKKQIRYADRKGIDYMLFPHQYDDSKQLVEIKNLHTGEQVQKPLAEVIGELQPFQPK
ncbi:MAG: histidine--tRNA ligase [bacterium]|nr:histidine--tRNA ligase [bacterium]